jgi:two-component system, chemotaxis family, chemotaxis protein CheY
MFSILIVDDSEIIRAVLKRTIEMAKIPTQAIYFAEDGLLALDVLQNEDIDIVFTDINMPNMNGIALVDAMKENPELQSIAIVVVSTEGSEVRIEQLKDKGINAYLRKPFTPESIRQILVEVLGDWNHG